MSMIRMLSCCCGGDGPDGPGTNSPLCNVVEWCYANKKVEPELISFATTGTKPRTSSTKQASGWSVSISNVVVTNKVQLGNSGLLVNRWRFEYQFDYSATFSGSSGTDPCGCIRLGVWEPFDITSFSGTSVGNGLVIACNQAAVPNNGIAVFASTNSYGGDLLNACDPPTQTFPPNGRQTLVISGGLAYTAGPYPNTLMDTCTELQTLAISYETPVKLNDAEVCGDENQNSNLLRITFNFQYQ